MSAEIIQLPDSVARQWPKFESDLTRYMVSLGATGAEIKHCLRELKPIFLKCGAPVSFEFVPGDAGAFAKAVNAWRAALTGALLDEIAAREIELFTLRGPRP